MPTRAKHHDFEPSEQFGLRYSATGKLVKISDPEARGKEAITYTNCLDIFDLAEALDIELTEEQAQEEAERIYENRKQFYNNHGYMKKKAIGEAYDGPVFNDDSLYRRSNGEKYTVRPDGSLESKAGKIIKEPNFEGFVHTFPRKHERTATFKEGRPRKDAAPVLTLPKQDNPLVQGECKTRTPEEASRSAAKQREQARKEATETAAAESEDERTKKELIDTIKRLSYDRLHISEELRDKYIAWIEKQKEQKPAKTTEEEKQIVREHYLGDLTDGELLAEMMRRPTTGPKLKDLALHEATDKEAVAEILPDLDDVDFVDIFREEDRRRFGDRREPFFSLITDKEIVAEASRRGICSIEAGLQGASALELIEELHRKGYKETFGKTTKPSEKLLQAYTDKELADKLRSRGYTVTATKTVEI